MVHAMQPAKMLLSQSVKAELDEFADLRFIIRV